MKLGGERVGKFKRNNGGSIIRYTRVEIFQNTLACFIKHYLITSHNFTATTVRKQSFLRIHFHKCSFKRIWEDMRFVAFDTICII